MKAFARFVVRFRKTVLVSFVAAVLLSLVWGAQVFDLLKAGGYDDPNADSAKVTKILNEEFGVHSADIVLIADMPDFVDQPQSKKIGDHLSDELRVVTGVDRVSSYYTLGRPPALRSDDGKAAYFFITLKDGANQSSVGKVLADKYTGDFESAEIYVAGFAAISADINSTISSDLTLAESIAIPITALLMIYVFGSLVAAGLPLAIAALSILGSLAALWIYAQQNDTSVFAVNLVTGMGLGLGIDYALLMINRFREERASGKTVSESVIDTVGSAGRTVLFSGVTVAIVLASMNFFPQYFLRSFAIGGISVVALAVLSAVVALPALLAIIGDRVNRFGFKSRTKAGGEHGLWSNTARFVMRRPLAITLITMIGLGGLMALGGSVRFGQVDDRILPATSRAVIANNVIRDRFNGREGSPVEILVRGASEEEVLNFTVNLSRLEHVVRVQSPAGIAEDGQLDTGYAPMFANYKSDGYQRIQAIGDVEPRSNAGQALIEKIRTLKVDSKELLIGGSAAIYTDSQAGIANQLPTVLIWIMACTIVLLFLFTGSVLLPIKAVILNLLSLGATIGFLSWVFIEGNLKWLIGDFMVTGTIDTSSLVLILVVAFGLSMDYELFLLSRIKEQHDAGLNTFDSVAVGLQRSGRIITTAALVLAVSFLAFVTSGVSIMKMLGLGIAFAILLDATIIRALLVPALMRLFGQANWWAPRWMKWIYRKAGLDH